MNKYHILLKYIITFPYLYKYPQSPYQQYFGSFHYPKQKKILFLDLCSITQLKLIDKINLQDKQKKYIESVKNYIAEGYKISFLFAMQERLFSLKEQGSLDQLQDQFIKDRKDIIKKLGNCVIESEQMIKNMILELREESDEEKEEWAELPNSARIKLLEYCNTNLKLYNQPSQIIRYKLSENVVKKALELGMEPGDHIILIIISMIYQSQCAVGILKFHPTKFDAHNALADLLIPSRLAKLNYISHEYSTKIIWEYSSFDDSLTVYQKHIKSEHNGIETSISIIPGSKKIFFPQINNEEYTKIINLLGGKFKIH